MVANSTWYYKPQFKTNLLVYFIKLSPFFFFFIAYCGNNIFFHCGDEAEYKYNTAKLRVNTVLMSSEKLINNGGEEKKLLAKHDLHCTR